MKKFLSLVMLILVLSTLFGCGGQGSSPEALIDHYLAAVQEKDYEAIWDMLPEPIQEYAIEEGIVDDKDEALDYIAFALNDYYWLAALDLPSRSEFTVTIDSSEEDDGKELQSYMKSCGVKMAVDATYYAECTITADEAEEDGSFYLIKYRGDWYLASVVGDDEFFEY